MAAAQHLPIDDNCPNCAIPLHHVEGTDVSNCNACGWTGGDVPSISGTVKPDEVTQPDEVKAEIEPRAPHPMDAAVDAMTTQPIPEHQEFLTMAATARMLSQSKGVPPALRDPYTTFHVVMMGRALNLDPATAINLIDVIGYDKNHPDNPVQLSLSPELLVARIKMMGLGSVELIERTKISATAVALRPDGYVERDELTGQPVRIVGEIGRTSFDWEGALDAELVDDRCALLDGKVVHWKKPGTNGRKWSNGSPNGCGCRGYKTYPENMFGWRAMGYCAHAYFSQATLGLYSPEELGASVDENGRAIDVATVDVPDGYESTTTGNRGSGTTANPEDPSAQPAAPEDISLIKARVRHLPDEERIKLLERWGEKVTEGRLGLVDELTVRGVNIARALINGAEQLAKSHHPDWKPYVAPSETPPEPPDAAEAVSTTPEPSDARDESTEADPGVSRETPDPNGEGALVARVDGQVQGQIEHGLAHTVTPSLSHVDSAIAAVKIMTVRALNASLRARGLAIDGIDEVIRRQNLARALAAEAAQGQLADDGDAAAGE